MGDAWQQNYYLSFAAYETLEKRADEYRYEFYNGEVWAMAGGSNVHNQIVQNIAFFLRSHPRFAHCRIRTETAKLEVSKDSKYFYPDVMLTCSPKDAKDTYLTREPELLVEVLSESTETKDLGKKADAYLSIPTLKGYMIVSQQEIWVRLYVKASNVWTHYTMEDKNISLYIAALDLTIPITDMYAQTDLL